MKVMLFLPLLLFSLFIGSMSQSDAANATVYCGTNNVTLRLNQSYLASLVSSTPQSVYFINAENYVTPNPACGSYVEGGEFIAIINETNGNLCHAVVETIGNTIVTKYTVRLFTDASIVGSLVSFDECHQWTFNCTFDSEYNLTAGPIQPVKQNFIVNKTVISGAFPGQITFYTGQYYNQSLNISQYGFFADETIYADVSIVGADQLLKVTKCSVVNSPTIKYDVISNGCPVRSGSGFSTMVPTMPNNQTVRFYFLASTLAELNASSQYFTLECMAEICDNSMELCSLDYLACTPVPVTGKRRRRSMKTQKTKEKKSLLKVRKSFRIVPACSLECDKQMHQKCKVKQNGEQVCGCMDGYQLQDDRKTCLEQSGRQNANSNILPQAPRFKSSPKQDLFSLKWPTILFYASFALFAVLLFILIVVLLQQYCHRTRQMSYKMLGQVHPRQET